MNSNFENASDAKNSSSASTEAHETRNCAAHSASKPPKGRDNFLKFFLIFVVAFLFCAGKAQADGWYNGYWYDANGTWVIHVSGNLRFNISGATDANFRSSTTRSETRVHDGTNLRIITEWESVTFIRRFDNSLCTLTAISAYQIRYSDGRGNTQILYKEGFVPSRKTENTRTINAQFCTRDGVYIRFTNDGTVNHYNDRFGSYFIEQTNNMYYAIIAWHDGRTDKVVITYRDGQPYGLDIGRRIDFWSIDYTICR